MLKFLCTLCFLFYFWLSQPALAWNGPGHMTTGAIAYSELSKNDPKALTESIRILKTLPNFDQLWKSKIDGPTPSDPPVEQVFLMLAARWSDDIRNKTFNGVNYDKPNWHYVNFPYKPPSQPASVTLPTPDPNEPSILKGIQENLNILASNAPDPQRAIALCWLAHLTGDIHQPLHTATLYTTDFPSGDRGGTRFYIRAKAGAQAISLHKFWDDLILGSENLRTVNNRAIALRNNPKLARNQLSELATTNFQDWAKPESFELAKKSAYLDGQLPGSSDKNTAPVLPSSYPKTSQAVAERRATLAGYRLADLLQKAL